MKHALLAFTLITGVLGLDTNILNNDIDIAEGVRLVNIPVDNNIDDSARSFGGVDTPLYRMARFLQSHELHVKLPNLIEKEKVTEVLAETLRTIDESTKDSAVTGRKKGGGNAGLALMGLMMAKTMGALGIGGLGLLTLKALMVSALALMLSAVVGIKKLASHDDHGGHEVYHVEASHHGHHRRRRDTDEEPLPYRAWSHYRPSGDS